MATENRMELGLSLGRKHRPNTQNDTSTDLKYDRGPIHIALFTAFSTLAPIGK